MSLIFFIINIHWVRNKVQSIFEHCTLFFRTYIDKLLWLNYDYVSDRLFFLRERLLLPFYKILQNHILEMVCTICRYDCSIEWNIHVDLEENSAKISQISSLAVKMEGGFCRSKTLSSEVRVNVQFKKISS